MVPMINPDFSEEVGIRPGIYEAKITGCEQKTSRAGNPYLNWTLEVNGIRVFHSTPISGRGAGLFKQLVRASVAPGYDGGQVNTDAMLGKIIQVKLEKETNPDGTEGKYLRVVEVKAIEDAFDSFDSFGK